MASIGVSVIQADVQDTTICRRNKYTCTAHLKDSSQSSFSYSFPTVSRLAFWEGVLKEKTRLMRIIIASTKVIFNFLFYNYILTHSTDFHIPNIGKGD
jgi:hypothetical protein